jgi:hypothetical protein
MDRNEYMRKYRRSAHGKETERLYRNRPDNKLKKAAYARRYYLKHRLEHQEYYRKYRERMGPTWKAIGRLVLQDCIDNPRKYLDAINNEVNTNEREIQNRKRER